MDRTRRKLLKTGAAATMMAAAPRVLAQQVERAGAAICPSTREAPFASTTKWQARAFL